MTHFETEELDCHESKEAILRALDRTIRDHLRKLDPAVGYHLAIGKKFLPLTMYIAGSFY